MIAAALIPSALFAAPAFTLVVRAGTVVVGGVRRAVLAGAVVRTAVLVTAVAEPVQLTERIAFPSSCSLGEPRLVERDNLRRRSIPPTTRDGDARAGRHEGPRGEGPLW